MAELDQIAAKCKSKQLHSALDQIDRAITKHGDHDCLLVLQTHLLLNLQDFQRARQSNQKFLQRHPQHHIGLLHDALLFTSDGDWHRAIHRLQDAMDSLPGDDIPVIVGNAFRIIGSILLSIGELMAARTHLQFAMLIQGDQDSQLQRLLRETYWAPNAPLILKTDIILYRPPEGKEWTGKYQNVIRAMNRGQFRLALKILERIDQLWPNQREVVHGLALIHCCLANRDQMSPAWRRASQLPGIPYWMATEWEALSQVLSSTPMSGDLDVVECEFQLTGLDAVYELLLSSPRFTSLPRQDALSDDQGPPPRLCGQLLDRDQVRSVDDISSAFDIPLVVGDFELYGRQTDRAPRLVMTFVKNQQFEIWRNFVQQLLKDHLADEGTENTLGHMSLVEYAISWSWHLPEHVKTEQHRQWISDYRRHLLLNVWTELPFDRLAGLTPLQAAGDPEHSLALEGLVFLLEQASSAQLSDNAVFSELRQRLQLPKTERLDAAQLDEQELTLQRISRIDPKTFSDEQLITMYKQAFGIASTHSLKRIVPEILDRHWLADQVPRDFCYIMLAQLTDDVQQGLEYHQLARHEAKLAGRGIGVLLVHDLEYRLTRGVTDKLGELIAMIRNNFASDRNVELEFARVLERFGLIDSKGRIVAPPSTPAEAEEKRSSSLLWTPDSVPSSERLDSDGSPQDAETVPTKIWEPGSD